MAVWDLQKSLLSGTASTFQWRFVGIQCDLNVDDGRVDALKKLGNVMAGKILTVTLFQLAR